MVWLSTILLLTTAAESDPPVPVDWGKEAPGARRDPFRPRRLKRLVRKVVPAVERAAGRAFRTPPVVEIAEPEPFDEVVRQETRLVYDAVYRDTPEALRARMVDEIHGALRSGLLGKYGIFRDTLYLSPDSLRAAAAKMGSETASLTDVVTVVLAHELVHALHDQHADQVALVEGLTDRDAMWALESTSEGLANWVEARVAAELGLTPVHEALNRLQGWSTAEGLVEPEAFETWSKYGLGHDMMAHHFARGGLERVWAVAARPPEQTRGVFRPEEWPSEREPPSLDYAAVLRGTEQLVTRGDWRIAISPLGEAPLWAEAYGAGDPARVHAVVGRIEEAWSLEAVRPDRQAQVRVVVFDGPEGARDYLALLEQHAEGLASRLGARLEREVEVVSEAFEQVDGDVAARRRSVVVGLGGTRLERHSAWVVRDDTLVVVLTEDFRPGLRLGWTIESVFARLEAARRGDALPPVERP